MRRVVLKGVYQQDGTCDRDTPTGKSIVKSLAGINPSEHVDTGFIFINIIADEEWT